MIDLKKLFHTEGTGRTQDSANLSEAQAESRAVPPTPNFHYSRLKNNLNANGAGIPGSIGVRSGSRIPVRVFDSCRLQTRTVLLSDTNTELVKRSGSGFGRTNWKPERCLFLRSLFN